MYVATNSAAAGVADVQGSRTKPVRKTIGNIAWRKATFANRPSYTQRHLCVISNLSGRQSQPSTTTNIAQYAISLFDFRSGHEFDSRS